MSKKANLRRYKDAKASALRDITLDAKSLDTVNYARSEKIIKDFLKDDSQSQIEYILKFCKTDL